jgi:gas vesicle protein
MGGKQHKVIRRSRSKSKSYEQHRKASKAEVSTMMRAITSELVVPESSEERRLWKERGLLEVQIEKKEKMIDNTRQRLKSEWVVQGKQTLKDEANEIQREVDELREEITLVDREIRVAEKDACI